MLSQKLSVDGVGGTCSHVAQLHIKASKLRQVLAHAMLVVVEVRK